MLDLSEQPKLMVTKGKLGYDWNKTDQKPTTDPNGMLG